MNVEGERKGGTQRGVWRGSAKVCEERAQRGCAEGGAEGKSRGGTQKEQRGGERVVSAG